MTIAKKLDYLANRLALTELTVKEKARKGTLSSEDILDYREIAKDGIRKATRDYDIPTARHAARINMILNAYEQEHDPHRQARILAIFTTLTSIPIGIYLLQPRFTGNSIAEIASSDATISGIAFILIGLIGAFAWNKIRY